MTTRSRKCKNGGTDVSHAPFCRWRSEWRAGRAGMETPTISINTPLEEVVMLARRFDQIAVEGDDTFEKAILETINAASLDGAARRRRARARTRKFGLLLLVAVLLGLIAVGVWIWPEFQSGGILLD